VSPAMSETVVRTSSVQGISDDIKLEIVRKLCNQNHAPSMHIRQFLTDDKKTTEELAQRSEPQSRSASVFGGGVRSVEDSEVSNRCRICMGTEEGQLYSVCRCNAGVHEKCLRHWLSVRPRGDVNCEICNSPYTVVKRRRPGLDCSVFGTLCSTWWEGNYCTTASFATLLAVSLAGMIIVISFILLLSEGINILRFPKQESTMWTLTVAVGFYWVLRCMEEMWFCFRSSRVKVSDFCCCCTNQFVVDHMHAQPIFSLR